MIPKIRRNYLGILGTTRISCDDFTNGEGYRGLVKVDREIRERRKIRGKDLRIFICF